MTPMVDVAFLLLTFFMLTASLLRHQAIEIDLPQGPGQTVPESNVLTIRVDERNLIFWNIGREIPQQASYAELKNIVTEKNSQHPELITLLKVDRKAKYHMLVDLLDEMHLAHAGRFSIAPMQKIDRQILQKISS